ncbi:MAG: DUF2971 domain-containing protein [Pirellulales bacterium]
MKLYKYRQLFNSPNAEANHNTRKMVVEGEIHFSNPLHFNDPFDCATYASMEARDEDVLATLKQMSRERFPQISGADVDADARMRLMRYQKDSEFQREFEEQTLREHYASRGVFCLSETCTSVPMWAHYAAEHRGICLELDLQRLQDAFPPISKVEYPPTLGAYNAVDTLLCSDDVAVRKLVKSFLTKTPEWAYEQEWRIIADSVGPKNYPLKCLTAVILGCRTSNDCENIVRSWMRERKVPFALRRAVENVPEMRLDIVDVMPLTGSARE